jgi:Pyruvate/2-oxoglutarate dehydrogenase complex, dihydrolipoamide dehydrogenase (E3) component, and related enzymes
VIPVIYDLIVLGGGAGGLTVAAGAAMLGAKVALVEKNQHLGGDCLHYGCVPSKAFIHAAKMAWTAKTAAENFGMQLTGPNIETAMNHVKEAIAHIQRKDNDHRFTGLGIDLFHGIGRFQDSHHLAIARQQVIQGKRFVIATGSRPLIPPIDGLDSVSFLTNETLLGITKVPEHLLVLGAGPVGLELGQAMARFGAQVTLADTSPALLKREDESVVPVVQKALEQELTFLMDARAVKVTKSGGKKIVLFRQQEKEIRVEADALLIAAGRIPNIDHIGLEHTKVKVGKHGIAVNEQLQTTEPHIYAIGDTTGYFPFTHTAEMEGRLVIRHALFGLKGRNNYQNVPWVIYTDPEIYHLGLTEKEARAQYSDDIVIYKVEASEVDRFVTDRENNGVLKVVATKKGKILGAHAVGRNAGDWMQELTFAKTHGHKIGDISKVIHPYPTHSAIVRQAADLYWRNKLFDGILPKLSRAFIRWFR